MNKGVVGSWLVRSGREFLGLRRVDRGRDREVMGGRSGKGRGRIDGRSERTRNDSSGPLGQHAQRKRYRTHSRKNTAASKQALVSAGSMRYRLWCRLELSAESELLPLRFDVNTRRNAFFDEIDLRGPFECEKNA